MQEYPMVMGRGENTCFNSNGLAHKWLPRETAVNNNFQYDENPIQRAIRSTAKGYCEDGSLVQTEKVCRYSQLQAQRKKDGM